MHIRTLFAVGLALAVAGCTDKDDDTASDTDTIFIIGFEIMGSIEDIDSGATTADNLCVELIDPTSKVFEGGELLILDSTEVVDGMFSFSGVTTSSTVGLLMLADDCDGGDQYMGLATGIPSDTVNALDYGDKLDGQVLYVATQVVVDGYNADMALAGYTGAGIHVDGSVMGWVIDGIELENAEPVDCATVEPYSDETVCYYADTDPSDGLFTTGGVPNTETLAAAESFYICTPAPIGTYTASDCNGTEYYEILGGSVDGLAQWLRIPQFE